MFQDRLNSRKVHATCDLYALLYGKTVEVLHCYRRCHNTFIPPQICECTRCYCDGEKGVQGYIGIPGLQGSTGTPGDSGEEGPRGPSGEVETFR